MESTGNTMKQIRVTIIILIVAIIAGLAIWWSSQRSSIKLSMSNSNLADIVLIDQKNGSQKSFDDINNDSSISIKSGEYRAHVTEGDRSYFALINAKGFFRSTTLEPVFVTEDDISFIGTDPATCGYFTDQYISYDCSANTDSVKVHIPATNNTPSYPVKNSQPEGLGEIGNIFSVNGKQYVIVQENSQREFGRNALYEVTTNSSEINYRYIKRLEELNSTYRYFGLPYKTGFIAHSGSLNGLYYYDTIGESNETKILSEYLIGIDKELTSMEVKVKGENIIISASNKLQNNREEDKSIVRIISNSEQKTYKTDKIMTKVSQCSIANICAFYGDVFGIFEMDNDSLKIRYSIKSVDDYEVLEKQNTVALALDNKVVEMDVEKVSGSVIFSHQGFELGGIGLNYDGLLIADFKSNKSSSVVIIRGTKSEQTSVIPTLSALNNSDIIDSISLYNKTVFITPKLGDFEFIESEGYFDYSPESKRIANEEIDKIISTPDVESSGFNFVNILE